MLTPQAPCVPSVPVWARAFSPLTSTYNIYLLHLLGYFSPTFRLTFCLSDLHDGLWASFLYSQGISGVLCPYTTMSWELSLP